MGFRTKSIVNFLKTTLSVNDFWCLLIYKVSVEFNKNFLSVEKNQITIGIKTRPVKGEANKEIIKKLAKHFKVSTSVIQIKSGHKSNQKIIQIQD